ncbi:MAG: LLM class flavin-dependent oxidoreductase [Chloroflexi bacterium]|nr:LLM class flavin-dependent oxidoreductase [Chloroflexota bacterium]
MPNTLKSHVGVMFRRENPPELLPQFARHAEFLRLNELWVVEDCFYASGIASAAVALACTDRIHVGLGIVPAVARNPAFTAMEFATLARIYPKRFIPGIGHGVTEWMQQIGAFPKSQLAAISETAEVVRRLLAGENVTFHGEHVHLDNVKLEFPPAHVPPVLLGVRSVKSLMASGRSADGTLLAEQASLAYVRWAQAQIAQGQAAAGRAGAPHVLKVYMYFAVDTDGAAAVARVRPLLGDWLSYGNNAYTAALGIDAELDALRARGADLKQELPEAWVREMSIVGTPAECAASIQRLLDAGAEQVILVPELLGRAGLDAIEQVIHP